jgi:hypothetical protein
MQALWTLFCFVLTPFIRGMLAYYEVKTDWAFAFGVGFGIVFTVVLWRLAVHART